MKYINTGASKKLTLRESYSPKYHTCLSRKGLVYINAVYKVITFNVAKFILLINLHHVVHIRKNFATDNVIVDSKLLQVAISNTVPLFSATLYSI